MKKNIDVSPETLQDLWRVTHVKTLTFHLNLVRTFGG